MQSEAPVLRTALVTGERGPVEVPPGPHHVVTVHASAPIAQSFAAGDRPARRQLRRGDIDLIPAGAPLSLIDEGPSQVLVVVLSARGTEARFDDMGLGAPALRAQFSLRDDRFTDLAWRLHGRAGRGDLHDECLTTEMLRCLHRAQQPGAQAAPRRADPLSGPGLRRVLDYIESHIDQPITIDDLALEAGLGATTFKAAFHAALGAPAHRYLVVRRAERARLMLLQGELPASQVALEAGFTHQTHMARWMRRLFGMLPSELAAQGD